MIDHTVGRVLDLFDLESGGVKRWEGGNKGGVSPRGDRSEARSAVVGDVGASPFEGT